MLTQIQHVDPFFANGYYDSYPVRGAHFTTVARVEAATASGLPKVIISFAGEALTREDGQKPEPWRLESLRGLMRLSRLRVLEAPWGLTFFGLEHRARADSS